MTRAAVETRDTSRDSPGSLQGYVSIDHPLRRVRALVDAPLGALDTSPGGAWAPTVRFPISPEKVVRALLVQFLFAIRRDPQLIDQIWYSTLFRWFVGIRRDELKWDLDAFAACRQRLLAEGVVAEALLRGLTEAQRMGLLTAEGLSARRRELGRLAPDVTVGVGQPGVLPSP